MSPIDFSILSADVLNFLNPYLPALASAAAGAIGSKIPEAVGALWETICSRLNNKEAAKESVEDLLKDTENEDHKIVFKIQLKKFLENDAEFSQDIQQRLRHAQDSVDESSNKIIVDGDGIVVQGSDNKVVGKQGVLIEGDAKNSVIITGNQNKIQRK